MSDALAQKSAPFDPHALMRDVVICNEKGLHARASAKFVELAGRFDAEISVTKDNLTVSATSIMGLLMLAASQGSTLHLVAKGDAADDALTALQDLVDNRFGEAV